MPVRRVVPGFFLEVDFADVWFILCSAPFESSYFSLAWVFSCGNVASILELDENLAQEYKVFQHAPSVSRHTCQSSQCLWVLTVSRTFVPVPLRNDHLRIISLVQWHLIGYGESRGPISLPLPLPGSYDYCWTARLVHGDSDARNYFEITCGALLH